MDKLAPYIKPCVDITCNTFRDFFGVDLEPEEPHYIDPEKDSPWDILSVISLSGAVQGAMIISMKAGLALKLAGILTGAAHTEVDADVEDTTGEIINIITGNIKPKVPNGNRMVLSVPVVINAREYSIAWPSKRTRILCIPFKIFNDSLFDIIAAIETESEKEI
jgi:CheY-specific phosphatase CheX